MRLGTGATLAVLLLGLACPAGAAELAVTVDDVCSDKGRIMLTVYDTPGQWLDETTETGDRQAPARQGAVVFHYALPPGTYAAAAYHDANGNGRFDTNFLGWPLEGFGFSNDAHVVFFTPPSFAAASIVLPPEGASIVLHMAYWSGC